MRLHKYGKRLLCGLTRAWRRLCGTLAEAGGFLRFLAANAERAALAGFALAVLLGAAASVGADTDVIARGTLRLHVVANSDAADDQALKLAVRDAVVAETAVLLADAPAGRDEAAAQLADGAERLVAAANAVLDGSGCGYRARLRFCRMSFPTRVYDGTRLPAGEYDAVRLELGAAAGRNWWCVLFPQLCVPAALGGDAAGYAGLTDGQADLADGSHYVWRLALWEWLRGVFGAE